MEDPALQTLFYPFEQNLLEQPKGDVLFLNAQNHAFLSRIKGITLEQDFAPFARTIEQGGFEVFPQIEDGRMFDAVLLLGTKNVQETRYLITRALSALKDGGLFICAAANDAGGKRLDKDVKSLGYDTEDVSKHKCRAVWMYKNGVPEQNIFGEWQANGAMQVILDGAFQSQTGLFSWDRADKGSQMFLETLSEENVTLKGRGADFGCGYGYLSKQLLEQHKAITAFDYIDADYRAVKAAEVNIKGFEGDLNGIWYDLTLPLPKKAQYDFIVMNPPFHTGKKTVAEIGQAFICNAAGALKPGGLLYMVANVHLPYEEVLSAHFRKVENLKETQGFKVLKARK